MIEPTSPRPDAASTIFNLPDYRVTGAVILACGLHQIKVEATTEAGSPSCAVISTRVHSRRVQRLRDIPVAASVEVLWTKHRVPRSRERLLTFGVKCLSYRFRREKFSNRSNKVWLVCGTCPIGIGISGETEMRS